MCEHFEQLKKEALKGGGKVLIDILGPVTAMIVCQYNLNVCNKLFSESSKPIPRKEWEQNDDVVKELESIIVDQDFRTILSITDDTYIHHQYNEQGRLSHLTSYVGGVVISRTRYEYDSLFIYKCFFPTSKIKNKNNYLTVYNDRMNVKMKVKITENNVGNIKYLSHDFTGKSSITKLVKFKSDKDVYRQTQDFAKLIETISE